MIDSVFGISRNRAIAGLALAICFTVLPAMSQTAFNPQTAATSDTELSQQEKKVIEYLLGVWGKDHSVTSVDQAMEAVGLRPSDETRFRICRTNRQRFNWFPEGLARFRPRLGIRRFGEDLLHDAIERVKPLTDGPDSDRTAEFEALILARVVGGPVGKARSVRIARFRELCPVSAHDLAEFFVVRAALPITRE